MHSLLFLSPDWLIFCHMIISLLIIHSVFLIYFLFLSDEGPMLETLNFTISTGSTPTFSYFDNTLSLRNYFPPYAWRETFERF